MCEGTKARKARNLANSLCPHDKPPIKYCIATGIKTEKGQPQMLCISVAFTQDSKLGLHPEMLPSLT